MQAKGRKTALSAKEKNVTTVHVQRDGYWVQLLLSYSSGEFLFCKSGSLKM
jgi:hypothetical protein